MARTMSDEQEREIHVYCEAANPAYIGKKLLAELDAERAAHAETRAEVGRLMVALHGDGSSVRGAEDELATLKARLALAEAVCESCRLKPGGGLMFDVPAYEAWRAGK